MKAGNSFEVVLKKARRKYIPKKLLKHRKIHVSDRYSFNASIWIADTPESNMKPTVNLTLQHNGDKIRFCFPDVPMLISAIDELRHFVGDKAVDIHNIHTEAVQEFLDFHEAEKLPPLNDYTVYTVIQDRKKKRKALVCDTRTGEIVETMKESE
jgi:hypothetical protein